MIQNQKFANAINRIPQKTPPVWFMRQAGRYHSHYRALREKYSFMELCKKPEIAAEVARGPMAEFDFDVAILFSDLLFPLEALGMGLEYTDAGPRLGFQLDSSSLTRLRTPDQAIGDLHFQGEALLKTRSVLGADKSLIGFVGGPWTLFVYAVEGGHSGSLIRSKSDPALYHSFVEILVPLLEKNIALQLDAGAEIVMLFDTAAGEVSPAFFREKLEPALTQLIRKFPGKLGYYSKGTQAAHVFRDSMLSLPWAGLGVDHRFSLPEVLPHETRPGFLQGNFDQALLFLEPKLFDAELERYLETFAGLSLEQRAGWVSGLGHGVLPKTPERNVKRFVERVREVF